MRRLMAALIPHAPPGGLGSRGLELQWRDGHRLRVQAVGAVGGWPPPGVVLVDVDDLPVLTVSVLTGDVLALGGYDLDHLIEALETGYPTATLVDLTPTPGA